VPTLVAAGDYTLCRQQLVAAHARGAESIESAEWALRHMTDFSVCTDLGPTSLGDGYAYKMVCPIGILVVTFAYEAATAGEGTIHLLHAEVSGDG
jgi:hypothetical protein